MLEHFQVSHFGALGVGSLLQLLSQKPNLIEALCDAPMDGSTATSSGPAEPFSSSYTAAPTVRMKSLLRTTSQVRGEDGRH